ncbi:MAG: hypothetical protein AAFQ15_17965, partial [Pseudomonadota bacterium]
MGPTTKLSGRGGPGCVAGNDGGTVVPGCTGRGVGVGVVGGIGVGVGVGVYGADWRLASAIAMALFFLLARAV